MRMFGILDVERAGPGGNSTIRNMTAGIYDVSSRSELFAVLREQLPADWHAPNSILVRFFYAEPDELPGGEG